MKTTPEYDANVAFAVMQEAAQRLVSLTTPLEAAKVIAAFGLMGLVEKAGHREALDLAVTAIASAIEAQHRPTVQ